MSLKSIPHTEPPRTHIDNSQRRGGLPIKQFHFYIVKLPLTPYASLSLWSMPCSAFNTILWIHVRHSLDANHVAHTNLHSKKMCVLLACLYDCNNTGHYHVSCGECECFVSRSHPHANTTKLIYFSGTFDFWILLFFTTSESKWMSVWYIESIDNLPF